MQPQLELIVTSGRERGGGVKKRHKVVEFILSGGDEEDNLVGRCVPYQIGFVICIIEI